MNLFLTLLLLVALASAQSPELDELQLLNKRSSDDDRLQLLEGQQAKLWAQVTDDITTLREKVNTLESKVQSEKISFTATAVSMGTFSANTAMVFDTVIEETGGSNYSPTTGKFTCPVSGVYAFSATLINLSENYKFYGFFMLDDVIQAKLYGKVNDRADYETSAGTITIRCNEGQTVYLQSPSDEKMSVSGYSFFSGFYLFD